MAHTSDHDPGTAADGPGAAPAAAFPHWTLPARPPGPVQVNRTGS